VNAGVNLVQFTVPLSADVGDEVFARFRFSSVGGLTISGFAPNGEVEDYAFAITNGLLGDFSSGETVDAADYVMWRKFLGTNVALPFTGADGDGDSAVDPGDYDVWQGNFGETLMAGAGGVSETTSVEIQEPSDAAPPVRSIASDYIGAPVVQIRAKTISAPAETDAGAARAATFAMFVTRPPENDSHLLSRKTIHRYQLAELGDNELLQLLAIDRVWRSPRKDAFATDDNRKEVYLADEDDHESEIDESGRHSALGALLGSTQSKVWVNKLGV
jgi:hypothetical protein